MKKYYYIIMCACLTLFIIACTDENKKADTPIASVIVNTTQLEINQSMEIQFTGIADQAVIYTGDKGHSYALRDSSDTGFIVNKGLFTYSYAVPGKFHVVCVASTYDTFMGKGLRRDTTAFDVVVKDDVTTIDRIFSSIRPNVYFAELVDTDSWMMCFPTKQLYNDKELKINTARVRLSIEITSDSSKIYVDEELYNSKNYYDMTKQHALRVVSDYGSIRNYKLYPIIYPEFTSIKIAGVYGTLQRNAYDQSLQTYIFALPIGTDLTHIIPEYVVDGDGILYANGKEITSGSEMNLVDRDVIYTLVRTSSTNAKVSAVSKIKFEVTLY